MHNDAHKYMTIQDYENIVYATISIVFVSYLLFFQLPHVLVIRPSGSKYNLFCFVVFFWAHFYLSCCVLFVHLHFLIWLLELFIYIIGEDLTK
jgi:hypothetical protein